MTILTTRRLVLRRFRADDGRDLQALISQYESSAYAAFDHPWPSEPEALQKVAEWFAAQDTVWAVCLPDPERLIGLVMLSGQAGESEPTSNLGFIFDRRHHGFGFASEACRAVLAHAFTRLQTARVVTGTAAVNTPAVRLLERLGFRRTAEGRHAFRNDATGRPISFLGIDYALERGAWELMNAV